ncbi:unnamed protein product [Bursaphelenchus okinawaensis]|uniref:CHK kinase-like domain-containing protein n=1 Tax=Bursaphelenchus okinawaensis TaxID=465554 RepID=A0A811KRS7_9BILA|nr:unnamed protein product [Bursaphelenchus okinawaensis]CAG9110117.1 unnamed protein product [Bursaphelenchus okinawaensis]
MGCSSSRCCQRRGKHKILPNGVIVPAFKNIKKVDSKPQLKNQKLEATKSNAEEKTKDKDNEKDRETKVERRNSTFDYFMGTNISLEWLLEQIGEKFHAEFATKPTWIIERLNQYTEKDIDKTSVVRVSFGWDNEELPKSVVLKISNKRIGSKNESENLAGNLFKKECNTYEWLQKVKRARIPKVHLIRSTFTINNEEPLIFMEDLTERSKPLELDDPVELDLIRDLLKQLAQVHAASFLRPNEWKNDIEPNPKLFYTELAELVESSTTGWTSLGDAKFKKLMEFVNGEYMDKTVKEGCKELGVDECLVHGNPIARNFFAAADDKHVAAIVDWVQAHPGCFAEDVAKAICWNLAPKDRYLNQRKLLEHYHFNLLKYSEGKANKITMEVIEAGFKYFLPFVAVCYLIYLPDDLSHASIKQLELAQVLLDDGLNDCNGGYSFLENDDDVNSEDVENEEDTIKDDNEGTFIKATNEVIHLNNVCGVLQDSEPSKPSDEKNEGLKASEDLQNQESQKGTAEQPVASQVQGNDTNPFADPTADHVVNLVEMAMENENEVIEEPIDTTILAAVEKLQEGPGDVAQPAETEGTQ